MMGKTNQTVKKEKEGEHGNQIGFLFLFKLQTATPSQIILNFLSHPHPHFTKEKGTPF